MEEFYKTIEVGQMVKIYGIDWEGIHCEAVVVVARLYLPGDDYGLDNNQISGRAYDDTGTVGHNELESGKVTVHPYHEEEDARTTVHNDVVNSPNHYSDSHYDSYYTLTEKDIIAGKIKMDAYFVAKVWKTGSRDDSGALWHSLKTIARFGEKNSTEREVKALYHQAKALARIYNVEIGD
jgi:hypothetical protein